MNRRQALAALGAGLLAGGCATRATPPSQRLSALMAASDEAFLERHPFRAMFRGDLRYAARHGEWLSDAAIAAERAAAQQDLAALSRIDRAALRDDDQVAFDAFRWRREMALREQAPELAAVWSRLPLDHFNGWHVAFATLSSGEDVVPYASLEDYENGLSRMDGFVQWLALAVDRCREGIALGIVQPGFVVDRMVGQFDGFIADPTADSPYYGPIRSWPAALPQAARERFARAYAQAIERRLKPALASARAFLAGDYRRAARTSVGISAVPGGQAWYRHCVAWHTTTSMWVDEIHRIGLDEVARLRSEMERVRADAGFAGTLGAFLEHIRTHERFKPASPEWLGEAYRAIGARVDASMPRLFHRRPRMRLEIRETPAHWAPNAAAASYTPGVPDGPKPGVFHFNTHDFGSMTTPTMESLYLHEAVPGHHHESALRRENPALSPQQRFELITAYAEGWALYAESLGRELGLYTDPYQRFGWLEEDQWRAVRLVVDTGLHARGWTLERAVDYMLANASVSRGRAAREAARYVVWPGQALAYKIGAMTIARLRAEAAAALGPRFDVRDFHAQVLDTGLVPLAVLQSKVGRWIAGGAPPPFRT